MGVPFQAAASLAVNHDAHGPTIAVSTTFGKDYGNKSRYNREGCDLGEDVSGISLASPLLCSVIIAAAKPREWNEVSTIDKNVRNDRIYNGLRDVCRSCHPKKCSCWPRKLAFCSCFVLHFFYIAWTNKSSVVRKPVLAQSVPTGAPVEMYVTIDF